MFKQGIDIGYRYVKGINEKKSEIMFPSVVSSSYGKQLADPFKSMVQNVNNDQTSKLEDLRVIIEESEKIDKKEYLVGEAAAKKFGVGGFTRSENRWHDENTTVMLATASALLSPEDNEPIHLVTGLPLDDFKSTDKQNAIKDLLKNYRSNVKINSLGIDKTVTFSKVSLFPQGAGCAYSTIYNDPERYLIPNSYLGLLDVGGKTTNYLVFQINENKQIEFISELSGTENIGMNSILDKVEIIFEEKTKGNKIMFRDLLKLCSTGEIYYAAAGKSITIKEELEQLKYEVVNDIKTRILTRTWVDILGYMSNIIIAGGGGKDLYPYLSQAKDVSMNLSLAGNPQMANAYGYEAVAEAIESASTSK